MNKTATIYTVVEHADSLTAMDVKRCFWTEHAVVQYANGLPGYNEIYTVEIPEPPPVMFVKFDGGRAGDWWSVYDQQGLKIAGAHRLRELRQYSITETLHTKGAESIAPQTLLDDFYADTLRWFIWNRKRFL